MLTEQTTATGLNGVHRVVVARAVLGVAQGSTVTTGVKAAGFGISTKIRVLTLMDRLLGAGLTVLPMAGMPAIIMLRRAVAGARVDSLAARLG